MLFVENIDTGNQVLLDDSAYLYPIIDEFTDFIAECINIDEVMLIRDVKIPNAFGDEVNLPMACIKLTSVQINKIMLRLYMLHDPDLTDHFIDIFEHIQNPPEEADPR
jgi:hypothetical protein